MRTFAIVSCIALSSLTSCLNYCPAPDMEDLHCPANHTSYQEAEIIMEHMIVDREFRNEHFIIRTEEEYDALFNDRRPYGDIDFTQSTLLSAPVETNFGKEIKKQARVCRAAAQNTITFTAEYVLTQQCQGIGIDEFFPVFSAIIPRIDSSTIIVFNIVDIDPFE